MPEIKDILQRLNILTIGSTSGRAIFGLRTATADPDPDIAVTRDANAAVVEHAMDLCIGEKLRTWIEIHSDPTRISWDTLLSERDGLDTERESMPGHNDEDEHAPIAPEYAIKLAQSEILSLFMVLRDGERVANLAKSQEKGLRDCNPLETMQQMLTLISKSHRKRSKGRVLTETWQPLVDQWIHQVLDRSDTRGSEDINDTLREE